MDDNEPVQANYRNFGLPLCLVSLTFFGLDLIALLWILVLGLSLSSVLPTFVMDMVVGGSFILPVFFLLVSLLGSILMVHEMKNRLLPWKAGIPLCVLFGVILLMVVLVVSQRFSASMIYLVLIAVAGFMILPSGVNYLLRELGNTMSGGILSFSHQIGLYGLVLSVVLMVLSSLTSWMSTLVAIYILVIFFCIFHILILMPMLGGKLFAIGYGLSKIPPATTGISGVPEPAPREKPVDLLRALPWSLSPRVKKTILVLFVIILIIAGCYAYWDITDTTPGRKWTQAAVSSPLNNRFGFTSIEYRGNLWVIGGTPNDGSNGEAWYTSNGTVWSQVSSPAMVPQRQMASAAVFKDGLWIIGGKSVETQELYNDVWYSGDGLTWWEMQPATEFAPRFGHSTVVFQDRIWVIGGNLANQSRNFTNDVWYSDDALHWQQATPAAEFSPRTGQSSFVYGNQLWVIGGMDDSGYLNDVWKSGDGIHWMQVTESAAFEKALYPAVVFDGRMWALVNHGIWWSRDGMTWTEVRGSPPFFLNSDFGRKAPAVFDNRLWVFVRDNPNAGIWYTLPSK